MSIPPFVGLPSGVIRRDIEVRGGTLATLSTVLESASERVLFVPGYTGSKEDFIAVLPALHEAGFHAVAFDQFGQYESRIDAPEERFDLDELAADVNAVARAIWPEGPRPHLVGHSLGGLVARAAVLNDPANFVSLTLLSSGPHAVGEHQHPALHGLLALLPDTDLATVWRLKLELERQAGAAPPEPAIAAFLEQRWLNNHPLALRAKAHILLNEPDRVEDLARSPIPLAVVCGDDDDVWWPDQQRTMSVRLGSHFAVIRNVGHSPAADAPAPTVTALRDFWRSTAALDVPHRSASQLGTQSAREARRFTRETLGSWGIDDAVIDDVELVASEMVTNALIHAEGPVQTVLEVNPSAIRIAVTDCTVSPPVVQSVADERESGRGMMIISNLSGKWGTETTEAGKTVWAELPLPSDGGP